MDEMYLIDPQRSNNDASGVSTITQVFENDYWGRPILGESSHKSWRPISVLLLRYLNNSEGSAGWLKVIPMKPILLQRLITVIIHTMAAYMVGKLAPKVFAPTETNHGKKMIQWMSFSFFAFHPAHVEVVANVANRPHVVALFCSLLTVDASRIEFIMLFWTIGLLSCETMVFQLPAVLLMATIIQWRKGQEAAGPKTDSGIVPVVAKMIPRYIIWIALTFTYLIGRFVWGTLTIPTALLERAEAPFVGLEGTERLLSYAYITGVHVGKSLGIDVVGFAHEYSHVCVDSITSLSDVRLLLPFAIFAGAASLSVEMYERRSIGFALLWLMALAWMATLFPISGFFKVGTFIADRMVLPSTMVLSVFGGYDAATRLGTKSKSNRWLPALLVSYLLFGFWAPRVWQRTIDWTEHKLLFERTLITCPHSAKNLLQLSKVYSGSGGGVEPINMSKALDFVQRSQKSDPEFCRVQFQYAHIYLRQNKHKKMEFHLTRAIHCPTSSSQAYQLWTKYWQAQPDKEKARKRQEKLLTDYEKEKQEAARALEMEQLTKRTTQRGGEL